jgi:hypothetical protein
LTCPLPVPLDPPVTERNVDPGSTVAVQPHPAPASTDTTPVDPAPGTELTDVGPIE